MRFKDCHMTEQISIGKSDTIMELCADISVGNVCEKYLVYLEMVLYHSHFYLNLKCLSM